MPKKRIKIVDRELKELLVKEGRPSAKKDFFELLKRAARTNVRIKQINE